MEKEATLRQATHAKHAGRNITQPADGAGEELVLAKSNLSAARTEASALVRRLSELEELNTRLREHILLRDSFERNMDKEYKNQLAQKEGVIRKLAALNTKDSQDAQPNAQPSSALAEVLQTSREEELKRLADHHMQRSTEQERLASQLTEQLNETNSFVQRLKAFVAEREELAQKVEEQLQKELAEKEEELNSLKRTGIARSSIAVTGRKELEQARQELSLKEAETRRLMLEITGLKETRAILERKLKDNETDLRKLREGNENLLAHLHNRQQQLSEEEALHQSEESTQLEKKLHDKDEEIRRLTRYYTDKEQAYEAIQSQLSEHIKEKSREIQRLKSFIAEREELAQKVEEQLQKEMAAKESELRELRHTKSHGKALILQRQLEHTSQIIKLKDAANRKIMLELASSKETGAILSRKLKDEQTHSESLKGQYEKIIGTIKEDNERIMKGLIEDYNARVATAKSESERTKAELAAKESELQVHKQRIDEAIREFGIRAQQVISMRESIEPIEKAATQAASQAAQERLASQLAEQQTTTGQPIQPEQPETATKEELDGYAKKAKALREALYKKDIVLAQKEAELNQKGAEIQAKEKEVKAMISTTEQRLKELERREDSSERKEQILLRQQEAFNRELQALEAAGSRLMTVESELESQLAMPVNQPAALPQIPVSSPAPLTPSSTPIPAQTLPLSREAPQQPESIEALAPSQQKIIMPDEIKPEKAKAKGLTETERAAKPKQHTSGIYPPTAQEKPAGEPTMNLEAQTLGYSEVEEAMSMIDVALQHGESIEQIKNSLLSSGYSKENVEKALKKMNL